MHLRKLSFVVFIGLLSCVSHDIDRAGKCDNSDLLLHLDHITDASGCGNADGEIALTATGGEPPYHFQLNDLGYTSQNIFSGLPSGIYRLSVKDENNCTASLLNLTLPAGNFKFSASVMEDTECVNHNGSITINVEEGKAPFTYQLMNGDVTDNNQFVGLAAGDYSITVKDSASCTSVLNVSVPKGNTSTSWTNDILQIMKASCAVSGCHDGKTRIDYRIYTNVKNNAAAVKSKTQDHSMPFDGSSLTQNQIDEIACWVDAGAPNN